MNGHHDRIWKNLQKSSSPEPRSPMTLKLCMQHQGLNVYIYNDDTGLTLTYFKANSRQCVLIDGESFTKSFNEKTCSK